MGQFLLPYVNRQVLQSRIKTEEKRFPKVARATLADTIDVCKDKYIFLEIIQKTIIACFCFSIQKRRVRNLNEQ